MKQKNCQNDAHEGELQKIWTEKGEILKRISRGSTVLIIGTC